MFGIINDAAQAYKGIISWLLALSETHCSVVVWTSYKPAANRIASSQNRTFR
jgi:hypothetical protein